ncbi:repair protein Rad1/Rec1/Rad17 [Teladorsagia circumcincta]|uniref:Repair protein Rad1/Rec1/Rad17 n=1 Tax=Teladorsagia circumcincta TaxID=45464 RepID=A0A2G9U4Q4_TELCI|nr:repair protein Rad1/Rec1/Rad17 [Teladorsagia circumcincta]
MQMAGGDARTDQIHVLELKKAHVRDLASIIKAISFRENATFQATPQGMRILVDDHLCQQECISMHTGSGATLKMTYDGAGEPVKLILEEDGIVVDMRVQTLTTEEILDFEFDTEDVTFQVIMKSYMLKEAIKELDASSSTVTLSVNNDELSLTTTGEIGKSVTKFPRHSEQIERLECAEPVIHQYPLNLIRKMNPAFAIASKVSLRCDSRGVLSAQFMVEQAERKQVYIEFYAVRQALGQMSRSRGQPMTPKISREDKFIIDRSRDPVDLNYPDYQDSPQSDSSDKTTNHAQDRTRETSAVPNLEDSDSSIENEDST